MKQSCVVLCLFLASVFASAQTEDCAALTHHALELSGFNQAIAQTSELLASEDFMRQMAGGEDAQEFVAIFKPIVVKEFDAQLMRQELQAKMVANCDPANMRQTLDHMQTPIMARMLALEAASNTPEGREKLKHYLKIAQTAPPTDDRMDALDALDKNMGGSDFATDTAIAVIHGMMIGIGAPPEIAAQIQAHRQEMKNQMLNTLEISMSVSYHGVTRVELEQYGKEMSAQPVKGFYDHVKKAFIEIAEERSKAVGQDLKVVIDARKANTGKS
jgi:hypothetical protein